MILDVKNKSLLAELSKSKIDVEITGSDGFTWAEAVINGKLYVAWIGTNRGSDGFGCNLEDMVISDKRLKCNDEFTVDYDCLEQAIQPNNENYCHVDSSMKEYEMFCNVAKAITERTNSHMYFEELVEFTRLGSKESRLSDSTSASLSDSTSLSISTEDCGIKRKIDASEFKDGLPTSKSKIKKSKAICALNAEKKGRSHKVISCKGGRDSNKKRTGEKIKNTKCLGLHN